MSDEIINVYVNVPETTYFDDENILGEIIVMKSPVDEYGYKNYMFPFSIEYIPIKAEK